MNVLISSIGSRGDVQPILALATQLQSLGHRARLCVAPDLKAWVESFGVECLPIGPSLKPPPGGSASSRAGRPSDELLRQLAAQTVRIQFPVLTEAARSCDLIVAAGALQFAARSVSEALGISYAFTAYCPAVLPSANHPPPRLDKRYSQTLPADANVSLWAEEEQRWNDLFGGALNEERAKLGLPPVESVQRHIFTDRPWLASDPVLGPAAPAADMQVVQTGAWFLNDSRALPDEMEAFLAAGDPPLYFGFGSMRATSDTSRVLIEAARALGFRSIVSQGWANLQTIDADPDCLSVGDIAHERLLPRVAAVVHHGGAGTTTAAARAGKAQLVVPHLYDQYYWAHRVQQLGIGFAAPGREALEVTSIISALQECMRPETQARAESLARRIMPDGAHLAAVRLDEEFTAR
jgi:vancomycin aglycone glucosyltransferase